MHGDKISANAVPRRIGIFFRKQWIERKVEPMTAAKLAIQLILMVGTGLFAVRFRIVGENFENS